MNTDSKKVTERAFTLVEIMVVVAIIGLVASLALPAFAKARKTSRVVAFSEDMRLAYGAFQQYAMDFGTYPPDGLQGVTPTGMSGYLGSLDWTKPTPLGGNWDWERNTMGVSAGISAYFGSATIPNAEMKDVDTRIDDGNINTGKFYFNGDRYTYMIEP